MFLFTQPPASGVGVPLPGPAPAAASSTGPQGPVIDAVREGARETGAGFDYLLRTAQRESSLTPTAKTRTSSATGLFQFVDQTWLDVMKGAGAKHGLQRYSDAIVDRGGGGLTVTDPGLRAETLALRNDPKVSILMAGELARRNGATLAEAVGRAPSDGELYVAHFLGARGASEFIARAEREPNAAAAFAFPSEAAANRPIFYDRDGRARSMGEVYAALTSGFSGEAQPVRLASAPTPADTGIAANAAWLNAFPKARGEGGAQKPSDGLFQSNGPPAGVSGQEARAPVSGQEARAPVSGAVTRLWSTGRPSSSPTPAGVASYFPRVDGAASTPPPAEPAPMMVTAPEPSMPVPTPPARPREIAAPAPPKAAAEPARVSRQAARQPGRPLDLQRFMTAAKG